MKRLPVMFFVALGLSLGIQDVRAQETRNADLHPPYLAEEESAVPEGEEGPALEEGEEDGVTERGFKGFKFKNSPQEKEKRRRFFKFKMPPKLAQPPGETPPIGGDAPPVSQCVVKTSDIAINPLIDIGYEDKQSSKWNPNDSSAQQSLMRMMSKGSVQERAAASGMVQAIKQRRLAGILRTDKQAVWKRAGRLSPPQVPIHVIPQGQNAMCLKRPLGEPPMIIYRQIRFPPSVFDQLLVTAWGQCGLPTPNPPCEYVRDMGNKPKLECYTNQQCVDKGLGNFCNQDNKCETRPEPKSECPPGTIPDASGEICILPGSVKSRCTDAEMHAEFQKQTDSCAQLKIGQDIVCLRGKGAPQGVFPCNEPNGQFYERCVVGQTNGGRATMACLPGSRDEILQRYRTWNGRVP